MASFLFRRILVSVFILIAASFVMFVLAANAGDPLQDLRTSNAPNREDLIAARTAALHLDVPVPARWLLWLGGAAGCLLPLAGSCDLGLTLSNAAVTTILPAAMWSTVQLITVALVVAVLLGVLVGVVTALRQHSAFDLSVTLLSFFLFSLPSFLIAVLLKEFIAIRFNDFLQGGGRLAPAAVIGSALVVGAAAWLVAAGPRRARLLVLLGAGAATAATLTALSLSGWFLTPGLGPLGLGIGAAAVAVVALAVITGLGQPRPRWIAAGVAGVGVIATLIGGPALAAAGPGALAAVALAWVLAAAGLGWVAGGEDRGPAATLAGCVAAGVAALAAADRLMQAWPSYLANPRISGRPIATVGSETPGLRGDLWVMALDRGTHLLLPTLALLLITFAGYTRYTRAGMLEVLGQDYIRTARAKGLPERVVVVRHALRNTLIPITTLVATEVGALLGGAIIAEHVFAIPGMGQLFNTGLRRVDLNPIMGYFVVIAVTAIVFNILADLAYSALDPRVRVRA